MRPIYVLSAMFVMLAFGQEVSDPWTKTEVVEPAQLAKAVQSAKAPIVISVAFPVLYNARHIVHAINAGPGSKAEGIELLKKAVASYPKDADIVLYCGCCPMVRCPNIRPAYRTLKEMDSPTSAFWTFPPTCTTTGTPRTTRPSRAAPAVRRSS